ncbi:MAG: Gfo/Idh/MocA family oxidoreductase [Alphaproteobacteria bacterium]|jgi:myo-inositol 2-dehydrogenase/D-chiro-inositol 1-dehydrogenase|nr:Gfo/Idh/MocA family oxidoreductase [Alphaproteobacteria bacterium]
MIDVALFGLGRIGLVHAKNIVENKEFNLKYVFDINQILAKKSAKKLNSLAINSPNQALNDKTIKSIIICTSTPTHIKFIKDSAKKKKIIFCEKPLDLSLKKVNECKKYIKKFNPKIQMGFNRRYDPSHRSLKINLDNGKIGTLKQIIITSRDPAPPPMKILKSTGTIFRDMMIHDFDLARFYLGKDEFNSIFATGSNISNKSFQKYKDYELATCVMNSKKGVHCVITNSRNCSFGYDQRVEIFGSKGMIISENQRDLETKFYNSKSTETKKPLMYFFTERYEEAYKLQLNGLLNLIKNNSKPLANFEDGRKSLILADNALKSIKLKKFVKINY